jgi:signal transduction histidine kinase
MKIKAILTVACVALAVACPSLAQESRATAGEAEAMVHKAVDFMKKNGKDKAYVEFTAPSKTFVDRDLYIVVYDLTGVPLAHGQNPKQVGKSLIDLKDPDGKAFVRERVELAKSKGKFWQDYKFTDPLTKQVLPKRMYCELTDEVVVCGGIYKS